MLSESDATLFDGDAVAELVTELVVEMKRRSGECIGRGDRPEDRARDQQCRQHPSGISDDHIKNCTRKLRKNLSSHLALAFLYTSRGSAAGAAACPPPPRTTRDATRCRPSDSDSRRWRVALEMKLGLGHAVVLSWVMRSCSENLVSGMVPP